MSDPKWLTELEERALKDREVELLMWIHPNEILRIVKLIREMSDAVDYAYEESGAFGDLRVSYHRGPVEDGEKR